MKRLILCLVPTMLFFAVQGVIANEPGRGARPPPAEVKADLKEKYRRPSELPFPESNGYSADKAALGKTLFFDPRLSASGEVSCASCHDPARAWQDGLPLAKGHEGAIGQRRSPTVENLAWAAAFMWDGRASSLEEQAAMPLTSPVEMNMPLDRLPDVVGGIAGYRPMFERAFGDGAVTQERVLAALATFVRTITSGPLQI